MYLRIDESSAGCRPSRLSEAVGLPARPHKLPGHLDESGAGCRLSRLSEAIGPPARPHKLPDHLRSDRLMLLAVRGP